MSSNDNTIQQGEALTPQSMAPTHGTGRKRGRPIGTKNKPRNNLENSGAHLVPKSEEAGSFVSHKLIINPGEDIVAKLIRMCSQGSHAISIISAQGSVSKVRLMRSNSRGSLVHPQTDPFDAMVDFDGTYKIIKLNGLFLPGEGVQGVMIIMIGDERVIGGMVAGKLVALTEVQLDLGSFLPNENGEPGPIGII